MRVIGVLDLLEGRAVHAVAGRRDAYQPIGDAVAVARTYLERFGLTELYAADLDAILGRAPQDALVEEIAALGARLWVDAGIASIEQARRTIDRGASGVVVGLETLPSYDVLRAICESAGGDRVAFSLDLLHGEPVAMTGGVDREPPSAMAVRAAGAGVGTVIVIDLARVGTRSGLDLDVVAGVRAAVPAVRLVVGGGVRGPDDLERLVQTACDGALVATALHDGRLTREQLSTFNSQCSASG